MAMNKNIGNLAVKISADSKQYEKTLDTARSKTQTFTTKIKNNFKGISLGVTAMAAASSAAFVAMAKKTLDYADTLAKSADAAGISIERLQELRYAGELAGISFNQMDMAVKAFSNRLGKDLIGQGGAAKKSLEALGLETRIANGELKTTEEVMNATLEAVGDLGTATEKTGHLTALFGDEVGKRMTVLLKDGYEAVKKLTDQAHELGVVMSDETVRKAEAANDAFFKMGQVIRTHIMAAILEMMPQITNMVNLMIENKDGILEFADNMGNVALGVAKVTSSIAESLSNWGKFLGVFEYNLKEQVKAASDHYHKLKQEGAAWNQSEKNYQLQLTEAKQDYLDKLEQQLNALKAINELNQTDPSIVVNPGGDDPQNLPTDNSTELAKAKELADSKLQILLDSLMTEEEAINDSYFNRLAILDEANQHGIEIHGGYLQALERLDSDYNKNKVKDEQAVQNKIDSMKANSVAMGLGLFKMLAQGHKDWARAAIAIEKGLAIAEAIQNTAVAVTAALKLGPIAGPPAAAAIQTMGNIQVGLIAATGLAQMSSAGGGSSLGSVPTTVAEPSYDPTVPTDSTNSTEQTSQITIRIVGDGDFKDMVVKSIESADANDEIRILKD